MDAKWFLFRTILIFYACTVMYLLLDVQWTKLSQKRKLWGTLFFTVFIILNTSAQLVLDYQIYEKFYLLLTQLPVFVLFLIISDYRGIKLFFVLLTTVFFSSPVMILLSVLRHFSAAYVWAFFLCNLALVFLIYRFFKKPFNYMLSYGDNKMFLLFSAIPLLYYIYSYACTKYQFVDSVISEQFFIRQIPCLIVLFSYVLLTAIFHVVSEKVELKNAQNLAIAQLNAATTQLEQLRITEQQSAIYRHDLRHHMNYLNICITENKLQEAAAYIQQIYHQLDSMKVERYSENEPINLILSSYAGKAKKKDVAIKIHVTATDFSRFHVTDLCSLLANALENAITAGSQSPNPDLRYINLRMYEKNNKLYLDLRNGYVTEPVFENGIPVSYRAGHGIGVKSMIHVVEQYEGIYRFGTEHREFFFQMFM
ncbi:MAG: GHKL domain-containing protein [Lachnospiraceae bacterium]|nr:GHKL domain-containing protein [Lachnospiraceae bacterium]